MTLVQHAKSAFPDVRVVGVALEVRSRESSVPWPLVLGIGRGVDADPTTTCLDVALERVLLWRVQDVPGGVEKDDRAEAFEVALGECACVLRRLDREAVLAPESLHRRNASLDGAVSEARGLGEDEDVRRAL